MVTNLEELFREFKNNPRHFQLADKLCFSQPQHLRLRNISGSAASLTVATMFNHEALAQMNHVVVCEDAETAAYFHNDLENLTAALHLFYFPSSFKNRKNFELLNPSHVMLRTEALTRFAAHGGQRAGMLITYPEALFEKVVVSLLFPKT